MGSLSGGAPAGGVSPSHPPVPLTAAVFTRNSAERSWSNAGEPSDAGRRMLDSPATLTIGNR